MAGTALQTFYDRLPIPLQELAISAVGWRSYRVRFGAPFRSALRELQQTDGLGADAMRADQERRLREMVRWAAATVPYYRDLFRREGIDPGSIRGIDDLPRIPFLDKETVRARARELRSEAIPDREVLRGHSSGTTGTALELFHSREALGWEYAVVWRQRGWFGVNLGEKFACFAGRTIVPGQQTTPPFWRLDRARGRMLFSLYHMTPQNLESYAAELARPGYHFWQGYPSSIGLISEHLIDRGIDLGVAAPAGVFTSSETLLDFHRERIARATAGAPIADRYGNAEFSVSVLQCPEGSYHVDTEFGVVEIDPHEEAEDWVRGEIVSTGFANRAMPLLRYRTGDVATLRKRGSCPCGRTRPMLERIDGRIEDYVITPDGRRVGRMDHIFKDALEVKEAQIFQPSTRRIVVRIVPRPGFGPRAQQALEREFRARLGNEIEIVYERTDAIPRLPNGKFRAVVSEVEVGKLR
jgi:phenylacetate-CoA ligase